MKFSYINPSVPENYSCSVCGQTNRKLWRQSYVFLNGVELLCAKCAGKDQNKDVDDMDEEGRVGASWNPRGTSDQIGSLMPAVPTEEVDTYWGYTSVPELGCIWWKSLPNGLS